MLKFFHFVENSKLFEIVVFFKYRVLIKRLVLRPIGFISGKRKSWRNEELNIDRINLNL